MRWLDRPSTSTSDSTAAWLRTWAGLLGGIALGTLSITLLWLGMRSVMAIGGACAEGGPYVPVQPCPEGVPLAMMGGMFGLFASAGVMVWFGSRVGLAGLPMLGWPMLFISLGWNFLEFGLFPPDGSGWVWGWLICAITFFAMGGGPLLLALQSLPPGTLGRLLRPLTAAIALAALAGVGLGVTLWSTISG